MTQGLALCSMSKQQTCNRPWTYEASHGLPFSHHRRCSMVMSRLRRKSSTQSSFAYAHAE
eukprot:6258286-Prorocentrum_lima.AAC.1